MCHMQLYLFKETLEQPSTAQAWLTVSLVWYGGPQNHLFKVRCFWDKQEYLFYL